MDSTELKAILDAHEKWLRAEGGGSRANLSRADLTWADLSGADLTCADLSRADLTWADLTCADLTCADLSRANLTWGNLSRAKLTWADLSRADLSQVNLSGANLTRANLSGADLSRARHGMNTRWPAPAMLLLASWGAVSASLCADLMRYDASCHPAPKRFNKWANDGPCPYGSDIKWDRACLFRESAEHWPGLRKRPRPPIELAQRLLAEKCELVEE